MNTPKTRRVPFWVDGRGCYVDCIDAPTLTATGLDLKAAANVDGQYQLMQDCDDGDDLAIGDAQAVVLDARGLTQFYAVPPTNGG